MSEQVMESQRLLRELAPRALAVIVRRYRNFADSEDAVQEALLAAAQRWPVQGIPERPLGWLVHVASRRISDLVRAESARRHREQLVVSLVPADEQMGLAADDASAERDDTLDLFFACCHPALSQSSRVALTLRALGGLTSAEIARAYMVPEATMAQRLSRAKQALRASAEPIGPPTMSERSARLPAVLSVLYGIFNEGYSATSGDAVHRVDLSDEAIRVARLLHHAALDEPEVAGLLGLLLLTDARRAARSGPNGELVPLDEQDRGLWNAEQIREGVSLVEAALSRGRAGPYQIQAAIAALHDQATSTRTTDWPQIVALYEVLVSMTGNPMARLSRAIALAMAEGIDVGLRELDELAGDPRLAESYRLAAARAHLLERSGQLRAAVDLFHWAANHTTSLAERNYLLVHAAKLADELASKPGSADSSGGCRTVTRTT